MKRMKVVLLGHGKMGSEVERVLLKQGHEIIGILDSESDWENQDQLFKQVEVAIDFSMPGVVLKNIDRCFQKNIPIVVGTTGWYENLEQVKADCLKLHQSFIFASNFSIGVNLFFELNRYLATLMSEWDDYEISLEETHHIHKKDAPSGTAIMLANDIIKHLGRKEKWVNEESEKPGELEIKSIRAENEPGTHIVKYDSEIDTITLIHNAKNRRGFALGAVMAAEWLIGRKGFFEMKDLLADLKVKRQDKKS
jgi:4-hydroxy-tetrahydrodipicolinate reductase